jgi:hypothetical protein
MPYQSHVSQVAVVQPRRVDEHELRIAKRPMEYNLVSRQMARLVFKGDFIPVVDGSELYDEYMRSFQSTRLGMPMGVVELEL